jgi:hypothetical protein
VAGSIPINKSNGYLSRGNPAGGRAIFLPKAQAGLLKAVLAEAIPVRDVDIRESAWPQRSRRDYDGALTYLHKVKDGRDLYFFANSSERKVDTAVVLRGAKNLMIWDPLTGDQRAAHSEQSSLRRDPVTTIRLSLAPFTSTFYVAQVP